MPQRIELCAWMTLGDFFRRDLDDPPPQMIDLECLLQKGFIDTERRLRRSMVTDAVDLFDVDALRIVHASVCRRVAGSAGRCRLHAGKAELGQIEFIDKGIDDANRVVRIDIILKTSRQKARLMTVGSLDKTSHLAPPKQCQIIA